MTMLTFSFVDLKAFPVQTNEVHCAEDGFSRFTHIFHGYDIAGTHTHALVAMVPSKLAWPNA